MRGEDTQQNAMFSYLSPEQRVPQDHPVRMLRRLVDQVLRKLSRRFTAMYAHGGRPSIPPEKLLRALLLQVLYTIRSERLLMEELDYNLLFRWFVGLNMDDPVWDATVYSKNRERLLKGDVAKAFFDEVLRIAREHDLLSDEHFTVDGTLIEAWASQKSFKKKSETAGAPPPDDPGNPTVDFRGEKRSNETHQSTTDPDARLYKKAQGQEAQLGYLGHALMENRNGLVVEPRLTLASGTAEREAALEMIKARPWGGAHHGGRRQELRHRELGAAGAGVRRHAACGPKQYEPPQRHRRENHAPFRLRAQSEETQAGGRNLWVDEDGSSDAPGKASGLGACRLDVYLGSGRLQSGAYAEPDRSHGVKSRVKCVWKGGESTASHPKGRQERAQEVQRPPENALPTKGIF